MGLYAQVLEVREKRIGKEKRREPELHPLTDRDFLPELKSNLRRLSRLTARDWGVPALVAAAARVVQKSKASRTVVSAILDDDDDGDGGGDGDVESSGGDRHGDGGGGAGGRGGGGIGDVDGVGGGLHGQSGRDEGDGHDVHSRKRRREKGLRTRFTWTPAQLARLQELFDGRAGSAPSPDERSGFIAELARLGAEPTERQLRKWFDNRKNSKVAKEGGGAAAAVDGDDKDKRRQPEGQRRQHRQQQHRFQPRPSPPPHPQSPRSQPRGPPTGSFQRLDPFRGNVDGGIRLRHTAREKLENAVALAAGVDLIAARKVMEVAAALETEINESYPDKYNFRVRSCLNVRLRAK